MSVLGIDEVGRGCWAGPLVVGAVVLGSDTIEGLADSKKLTKKQRQAIYDDIIASDAGVGLGWVSAQEIDTHGLSWALVEGTKRAVAEVKSPYHEIIIDGTINFLKDTTKGAYVTTLPKADDLVPCVSAASIVAKVARDTYMTEQAQKYPAYGFGGNAGYGVKKHREAIDAHGVTPLHRLSFAPLAKYREQYVVENEKDDTSNITTKQIGDNGETVACNYLVRSGYTILERNWRTRHCEIDIIARNKNCLYFIEVKARKDVSHGDGLAAITPKKQQQMQFAAEYYATQHGYTGDMQLAACSVIGGEVVAYELLG